jgi:hypothetical protein
MGIAVPDTAPRRRPNLVSATHTAIALVFFFGVGLAGGTVYKMHFGDDAALQVADQVSPPPSPLDAPPAPTQNVAANRASTAADATRDLAYVEPSTPPALAPSPVPTPAEAITPHAPSATIAEAAPPAPQAQPAEPPAPIPYAEIAPARPDVQPDTPATAPQRVAAIPLKKPAEPTATHRPAPTKITGAPQAAALHASPPAPGKAGLFRVQFGAFANEENARRVQWAIEATGVKVEVSQEAGPSGRSLFFLRSPAYPDYATALSAAQAVQNRAKHFVNPIAIDYTIRGDRSAPQQQAQH